MTEQQCKKVTKETYPWQSGGPKAHCCLHCRDWSFHLTNEKKKKKMMPKKKKEKESDSHRLDLQEKLKQNIKFYIRF